MSIKDFEIRETKLYASIGKVVVKFEFCQVIMKKTIEIILTKNGLQNTTYSDILMFNTTGAPLLDFYKGSIIELYNELFKDNEIKDYFNLLFKKIKSAIELRNDVAHAFWVFGYVPDDHEKYEEQQDIILGNRYKITKDGVKNIYTGIEYTVESFEDFGMMLDILAQVLLQVEEHIKDDLEFSNLLKDSLLLDSIKLDREQAIKQ
jgi:hypothetical protein